MFESIDERAIYISLRGTENKSFDIPHLNVLDTASTIWNMCTWLFEEFVQDCKTITNFNLDDGFCTRNGSRIMSYSNQVCLLEGILLKLYEETWQLLTLYIDKNIEKDKTAVGKRKLEIAKIRNFRNKVAAHTVYANPYKDDNSSDELASVTTLTSWGITHENILNFSIGGMVRVHKDKTPNHSYRMGLYAEHLKMEVHFNQWEAMFAELIDQAESFLPIKDREIFVEESIQVAYKLSAD